MPKVSSKNGKGIILPEDFMQRRKLPSDLEYWLDERDGDLILHPCLPDARKLYIEATTACNLECRTCIRNVWEDPQAHMKMDTFQRIVRSLPGLPNLERVIFTSFGEPFTNPRLLDMVETIREYDLAVTIGTNGLLVTSSVARDLVKLGVDRVIFSIDGGNPETYARVRGARLSQVVDNIRILNDAKQRLGAVFPAVGIEFVVLRSNVAELADLARLGAELNVSRLLISHVLPYTEEMRDEVLYSHQPVPPFRTSSWALKAGAWVMWATQEMPRMHWGAERRCRFVQNHAIVVGWDGGVSPCYALSHNYSYYAIDGQKKQVSRYTFGDVNLKQLHEIWLSEEYVRFRSEVKANHFPSCPDCDLRESCDLRQQNKGCWGWSPSCSDCLWAQDIVRCP
jgi:Fe-coproporphyrin III synthase